MKRTVILGASTNPSRYSNIATRRLIEAGHEVFPLGIRVGEIDGVTIDTGKPKLADIDTITMYLNKDRQHDLYDYIISLHPKRIIFNPGTENTELAEKAQKSGIHVENSCTLVLLSTGQF